MNEVIQCKKHKLLNPPDPTLKVSGYKLVTLAGNNPKLAGWRNGELVNIVNHDDYKKLCEDAYMWRNCGGVG
jgi:hypothetical protein